MCEREKMGGKVDGANNASAARHWALLRRSAVSVPQGSEKKYRNCSPCQFQPLDSEDRRGGRKDVEEGQEREERQWPLQWRYITELQKEKKRQRKDRSMMSGVDCFLPVPDDQNE